MAISLDAQLVSRIKNLKMEFKEEPQPELLIAVPNPAKDVQYWIKCETKEFTSLCPFAPTQPDMATIVINYSPDKLCVELKSLKFYLVSFRQTKMFHEQVPTTIGQALTKLLDPHSILVTAKFTTRGGIDTEVSAYNIRANWEVFLE